VNNTDQNQQKFSTVTSAQSKHFRISGTGSNQPVEISCKAVDIADFALRLAVDVPRQNRLVIRHGVQYVGLCPANGRDQIGVCSCSEKSKTRENHYEQNAMFVRLFFGSWEILNLIF
jgi:hypothetical protein